MSRPARLHIAIGVSDLQKSRKFYANYLRAEPTRVAPDQVDWILDCPPVNFSIFYNPDKPLGPEHIGLDFARDQLAREEDRLGVKDAHILDPDGIRVEVFSSDPEKSSKA